MNNKNTDIKHRIKHTNYRITDVDRTIKFYSEAFGMQFLYRIDIQESKRSLIFIGYGEIDATTTLELTYDWDSKPLDLGDAYRHICIGTNNLQGTFDKAIKSGATVVLEPFKPAYSDVYIAFIKDPDGYTIELMEDMTLDLDSPQR
jgi:lactoylglutathione lyase